MCNEASSKMYVVIGGENKTRNGVHVFALTAIIEKLVIVLDRLHAHVLADFPPGAGPCIPMLRKNACFFR